MALALVRPALSLTYRNSDRPARVGPGGDGLSTRLHPYMRLAKAAGLVPVIPLGSLVMFGLSAAIQSIAAFSQHSPVLR